LRILEVEKGEYGIMKAQALTRELETPPMLPTFSRQFILAYVTTMRPYLMFVSGITGIAGLSHAQATSLIQEILVALASFLSYGFGQALTDCFQTDTDRISSPYRPLTQGIITRTQVLSVTVTGLLFCVWAFGFAHPLNYILGILAGLGLATYTPFKRQWWGGPFYNAWIVANLCFMAMLVGPAPVTPGAVWTLSAAFFGYANFVLSGYFKDIAADRATGYNTFPVVFGRYRSALVSDIFALTASVSAIAAMTSHLSHLDAATWLGSLFACAGILAAVIGQLRLHSVKTDQAAHRAIVPVVHSYILLLSAIAVTQKPEWFPGIVIFYAAFVATMRKRPEKSQI
jgi:4-hydroxybenzoate polyprenyltransferase